MAEALGSIGYEQAVNVRVGDALLLAFALTDEANAAINLTGAAIVGTLSARDAGAGADINLPVVIATPASGAFTVEFTAAITNAMTATDAFKAKPTHNWKLVLTDSAGRPQTLFYGIVNVAAKGLQ